MPNFSYTQPTNPWTLSMKSKASKESNNSSSSGNKSNNSNNSRTKSRPDPSDNDFTATFHSARQALVYNQMLAGKYGGGGGNPPSSSQPVQASAGSFTQPTASSAASNHSNLPAYQPFKPPYPQNKRLGYTGRSVPTNPTNSCTNSYSNNPPGASYQSAPSYQPSYQASHQPSCQAPYQSPHQPAPSYQSNHHSSSASNASGSGYSAANQLKSIMNGAQAGVDLMEILADERAKNLDKDITEKILNEIIDKKSAMTWDQIGGLHNVKDELEEIVILPMKRPDVFVDLLSPCKGLLLFGPPGTGKTLIGRCIASQSNSTFFSISASSLTSKWVGEGEKMVRTLFTVARIKQPSVIFIDEIDSLLTQRSEGEHESSRRIKTEFLVQFDGVATDKNENLLVIGATNLPHTLDEAARRRFTKRLYIPLPNLRARRDIINLLMKKQKHDLDEKKLLKLCRMTKGYSGADLAQLCKDAALNIIRRYGKDKLMEIKDKSDLPPINLDDFLNAVKRVKATVSEKDLVVFKSWNNQFGAIPCMEEDDEEEFDSQKQSADDSVMIVDLD